MAYNDPPKWPPGFANCVTNEIIIDSCPDLIWFFLTNAKEWYKWYPQCSPINILDERGIWFPFLLMGTKWSWTTFGYELKGEIKEFVVNERLAWEAHMTGFKAYHVWSIVPIRKDGREQCRVVSECKRTGIGSKIQNFIKGKDTANYNMFMNHQQWIVGLCQQSELCQKIRDQQFGGGASGERVGRLPPPPPPPQNSEEFLGTNSPSLMNTSREPSALTARSGYEANSSTMNNHYADDDDDDEVNDDTTEGRVGAPKTIEDRLRKEAEIAVLKMGNGKSSLPVALPEDMQLLAPSAVQSQAVVSAGLPAAPSVAVVNAKGTACSSQESLDLSQALSNVSIHEEEQYAGGVDDEDEKNDSDKDQQGQRHRFDSNSTF